MNKKYLAPILGLTVIAILAAGFFVWRRTHTQTNETPSTTTNSSVATSPPAPVDETHMAGGVFSLGAADGTNSQETTWEDPTISGVFVRIPWSAFETAPNQFDFSSIDHELNQAVVNGKRVSIGIGAGKDWTPTWLFTDGGVTPYHFQDAGSGDDLSCGAAMTLGNPADPTYQKWYFGAIQALGEHIKTNPSWYGAIAYVKPSGANLFTYENRLPDRCSPGCVCNTQVWASAGLTPSGLRDFYLKQMDLIQLVYPGKPMMYALIQDGFPKLNDAGDYLTSDGTSSGAPLENSGDQLDALIAAASTRFGQLFVVAHNGLQTDHAPNPWVVKAGNNGQPTAFQTVNPKGVGSPEDVQHALENLWNNTHAHYLEIYESVLQQIEAHNGMLVSDTGSLPNTLAGWNLLLQTRAPALP